jgi:putative ABC transport system ATP-binding protein
MGPSGSGKSTLMNLIGCLDTPTAGEYILNGHSVAGSDDDELARIRNREIGFVFQTFNLLPAPPRWRTWSCRWSTGRGPRRSAGSGRAEALRAVELADRMGHRPNELSGGQRQRVAIARALVTRPSIILADEPTGNLDSRTSEEIMALFERLHAEGQTIIMVTHEPDIAAHAERLVTLRDGVIESDQRQVAGESGARPARRPSSTPRPEPMNLREALRDALEMIRAHKLRAFFTVLGTVVGVTFLIAVVTLIQGMNDYMEEDFAGPGLRLQHRGGAAHALGADGTSAGDAREWQRRPRVSPSTTRLARGADRDAGRAAISSASGQVTGPRGRALDGVRITAPRPRTSASATWRSSSGRVFSEQEAERGPVAVLGKDVADRLFEGEPDRQTVRIQGFPYRVIGVLERRARCSACRWTTSWSPRPARR